MLRFYKCHEGRRSPVKIWFKRISIDELCGSFFCINPSTPIDLHGLFHIKEKTVLFCLLLVLTFSTLSI